MAKSLTPLQAAILNLLLRAEKSGVHAGGLFLIAMGLYGGQYASLFPDQLKNIAGSFCLIVAGSRCRIGLRRLSFNSLYAARKVDRTDGGFDMRYDNDFQLRTDGRV